MHTTIICEIGPNHQGDIGIAKKLIDVAVFAGCDIVKFQKKTPEICLPERLWGLERDTPFGRMSYLEYRKRIEFGRDEYHAINVHCFGRIIWTASPWDVASVDFLKQFGLPVYKIASASVTDLKLLLAVALTGKDVIMSVGMSTLDEIWQAKGTLENYGAGKISLLVCTSTYPCPVENLNLKRITALKKMFPGTVVGYSGHESGLWTTLAAVAMGAEIVERHITLDRTMVGSDHAASVEPQGLIKLVKEIRNLERAMGDGHVRPIPSELPLIERLRK